MKRLSLKTILKEENDNLDMIVGIIDMLLQIEDIKNRKEIALDQIKKFKEEGIHFDYQSFLDAVNVTQENKMKIKSLIKENDAELDSIIDKANSEFEKKYNFSLNLTKNRVAIEPTRPLPYPVFPPKMDKDMMVFLPKLELEATSEWSPRKKMLVVHIEVSVNRKKTHTIKFEYLNGRWDHMVYS